MAHHERIFGLALPFHWLDIGSIPDFWEGTQLLLRNELPDFVLPGTEVRPGIHAGIHLSVNWDEVDIRGPVYIGSGTAVAPGARIIGPTVIGSNCVIESGAVLDQCILADYTRVSSVAALQQKIIFGTKCIDPSGKYLDIEEGQLGWIVDDARRHRQLSDAESELWEQVHSLY